MPNTLFNGVRQFMAQMERAGHTCRVVREAEPEEALTAEPTSFDPDIHHVESDRLLARDTGFRSPADTDVSGFRFFLDGVQYSHLVGFLDNLPLVHHLSAAAILRRDPETRALRLWQWTGPLERLLVPAPYVDVQELERLGVPTADTMDKSPHAPAETVALRALAHSKSQRLRREQEVSLIKKWVAAGEEGWLMVDGPLMLLPEIPRRAAMAGVVKSFGAQFFQGEEQLRVMSLPAGHRTTAFQLPRGSAAPGTPGAEERRRWYSWYVRVRDPRGHDADFGLLRIETPPEPANLDAADEISRWVIAERTPLSTPDPRWANLLYPIHACERYLKSALPERNRVHLLAGGVAEWRGGEEAEWRSGEEAKRWSGGVGLGRRLLRRRP